METSPTDLAEGLKDFENIALRHDPIYAGVEPILEYLLEFIAKHGLCIYGGLAIDYALRLKGDKLYPDDLLQIDYDFLSPNHVEHAYDLADAFYKIIRESHGAEEASGVRTINALHVKTMRVDIRDNHFLADVTYCPESIFPKIPVLTYKGVKIIHPDMQRIDIHSSLSFPYDYPPMEVIFSRWKKDITRFKMLEKYYPLVDNRKVEAVQQIKTESSAKERSSKERSSKERSSKKGTISRNVNSFSKESILGITTAPTTINKYVLTGFSAYGIIYSVVAQKCQTIPDEIIKPPVLYVHAQTEEDSKVQLYGSSLEIVHFNPDKCIEELALAHTVKYHPVINMIPETIVGMSSFGKVEIDVTTGRLLSSVSAQINGKTYRLACTQYILRQFLAEYHYARMIGRGDENIYLDHYISLMRLMEIESMLENTELSQNTENITRLSVVTYGDENTSLSKEVEIRRVLVDIGKAVSDYLPSNYYPAKREASSGLRPQYDIKRNDIFIEDGSVY